MQLQQHSFDGHCHTSASDGTNTPVELIARALSRGLSSLHMTDHDTLNGYLELCSLAGDPASAASAAGAEGFSLELTGDSLVARALDGPEELTIHPAAELSCEWNGATIHLLAYSLNPASDSVRSLLESQMDRRRGRATIIAERVSEAIGRDDLTAFLPDTQLLARPHFAQALVAMDVVKTEKEAFSRFLGRNKPGDVSMEWPAMDELIASLAAQSIPLSLAHPDGYQLSATRLRLLIDDFCEAGGSNDLQALEVSTPDIKQGKMAWLAEQAGRRGLCQTAGSDYHGVRTPWRRLGMFPAMPTHSRYPAPSLFSRLAG